MLTIRIMPKMRESPPASRNRSAPYETPLNVCATQNSIALSRLPSTSALVNWLKGQIASKSFACWVSGLTRNLELETSNCNFKGGGHGVPARPDSLFSDHRSSDTSPPEGRPGRGVDHRQRGGVGHPRAHAAHGAAAAWRNVGHSRHPQLRLV